MKDKPKILVIDDDKDVGYIFKKALAMEGYSVLTALDGVSGLRIVKEKKPDIVLLDLKMSKMNGIEVLRRIKKIDENIVVIIITGYGTMDTARTAMKFGAFDYITKPIDLEHVNAVIKDGLKLNLQALADRMKEKVILRSIRSNRSRQVRLSSFKHCNGNQACLWEVALRGYVLGEEDFIVKWMEDPDLSKEEKLELTRIADTLKV